MRTTTKRGLGRTATFNGDGDGHAVLPPAVLEPMRRYRQPPPPPRSRGRLAASIFGWILLALVVVIAGLAGGLYLYGHETLNSLAAHSKGAKAAAKDKNVVKVVSATEPATALVIGYDTRKGRDAADGFSSRSDTVILMRADPTTKTLSLLSFPRDLVVPIYCGSDVPVTHDRINSAWSTCPAHGIPNEQGTLDTVAHLAHVPINYVITVDFHGFKLLVNKLHGVYVDVDHRYYIPPNSGTSAINLEPGYQKLNGGDALSFVRYRHTDSDLYRNARQQLFLAALKDRLASSFSLTEVPGLIGAVKGSVEVVQAGGGAPNLSVIQSYVGLMYGLPPGHLFRTTIQNLQNCGFLNAEVCANDSDVAKATETFMHPDVTVSKRADCQVLGCKVKTATVKKLKPSDISTLVLNGTTIAALAHNTSYDLSVAGYNTVQLPPTVPADFAPQNYTNSEVFYDPVQANAKSGAEEIAQALGDHVTVAPFNAQVTNYAQQAGNPLTVVVVGSSFTGQLVNPADTQQAPPPKQAPQVQTYDASSYVHGYHVPFRMYLPHVVASGSRLSSMEPVRVFNPSKGNHEFVLTFVTGAGNVYYQVIETDWTSAPALRAPTSRKIDRKTGRTYDLYTTSGHIHLVAFRKGNASYWVYNTLQDELSNETMLAIARGLQPVTR